MVKRLKKDIDAGYKWTYYPTHKQGYLRLQEGKVDNTLELVDSRVLLDRDKDGNVLGVEILL